MRLTVSCAVYGNLGEKALHEAQFPISGSSYRVFGNSIPAVSRVVILISQVLA